MYQSHPLCHGISAILSAWQTHVSKSSAVSQNLTETVGLADSISKSFAVSQNLTETLGFVDDVSKSSAVSQNLTETLGFVDDVSKSFAVSSGPQQKLSAWLTMYQSHPL